MRPETMQKKFEQLVNRIERDFGDVCSNHTSPDRAHKPMNGWEFLNQLLENILALIGLIILTPFGWIGLMLILLILKMQ